MVTFTSYKQHPWPAENDNGKWRNKENTMETIQSSSMGQSDWQEQQAPDPGEAWRVQQKGEEGTREWNLVEMLKGRSTTMVIWHEARGWSQTR